MKKDITVACCLCNHTGQCPWYSIEPEPRGTVIAGWTIFSDLRANAAKLGLSYEHLQQLTELASEYEVKYDALARKTSSLRLRLSEKEMTHNEAKSVLDQIITVSSEADYLFLDFVFRGRRIIPDEVWNTYTTWVRKTAKEQRIV